MWRVPNAHSPVCQPSRMPIVERPRIMSNADNPYATFGMTVAQAPADTRATFIRKTYMHLTAAVYATRKMMKVALITREFGGQVSDTSVVENFPGFQTISGQELVNKFIEQVKKFEVPLAEGESVSLVTKDQDQFKVQTESGQTYTSRTVIAALGKRYRKLKVPGESELTGKGVAFCATCDAPFFKDKQVVVAGGGNSAFSAARDLLKVAKEVTLVNFSPGWQADQVLFEPVQKHTGARLLDNHEVTRIEGTQAVEAVHIRDRKSGEEKVVPADGIFIQIGLLPNTDPFSQLAQLNQAGELIIDCHCRTNVEGLFGAGDMTTVPYDQIVISAGEGAKAALSAYDFLINKGLL